MTDLVVISQHEKGFWMGDFYEGGADVSIGEFSRCGRTPDAFFTMNKSDTRDDAYEQAKTNYPGARIVDGETDETDDEETDGH